LIEITYSGSIVLIMCVVGFWRHILTCGVCVYACVHACVCVCTLCWSGNYCSKIAG